MTGVPERPLFDAVACIVLLFALRCTGTTSSSESLSVRSTCDKKKNGKNSSLLSDRTVLVDCITETAAGSDGLTLVPLFSPFSDCFLILDFGESSEMISANQTKDIWRFCTLSLPFRGYVHLPTSSEISIFCIDLRGVSNVCNSDWASWVIQEPSLRSWISLMSLGKRLDERTSWK